MDSRGMSPTISRPWRKPRWALAVLAGVLAASVIVGSCGGSASPGSTDGQDTLRVALATFGAEVLDPSLDSQAGLRYHGHMYDHLLGPTSDGRASTELGALQGWDSSPDARRYTLTLRKGMKWHDGVEVTADDIRFSMDHYSRVAAACATCGYIADAINTVRPLDRYSVDIELKEPDVSFIIRLGPAVEDVPLLPFHRWDKTGANGFAEDPIGSGPWRFLRRSMGESIEYEANGDYWNPEHVPGLDRMRLVQVSDGASRVAMLRTGIVDVAPIDVEYVAPLREEGFQIDGPKNVVSTTLRFFMSYDPAYLTSKLEFRKALVLGTDLRSIVDRVYPPEAATLSTGSPMFDPLAEGYDPRLAPYGYDPEQARELLRRIGYGGETVYLMSIAAYELTQIPRMNEMIADDWRRLGLNVSIVPGDYTTVKARYGPRPQRFDDLFPAPVFHGGHIPWPGGIMNSVERYLTTSRHSLLSYHDLPRGDAIYEELKAISDLDERRRRLVQLNRKLYDEYWAAPIIWRHDTWGLRADLTGWQPTDGTFSDLHFETVRLKE